MADLAASNDQKMVKLYTKSTAREQLEIELEQSLQPRGWDTLLDLAASFGLTSEGVVLDIGCGNGEWSCKIAKRTGARVVAVDLVPVRLQRATENARNEGLESRVDVREGTIHSLPMESATIDLVWCRDMLNHVPDLAAALAECRRVMRPGGRMIVYQTFAAEMLEPVEAARLYRGMQIVPESMSTDYFERAVTEAGLSISLRDVVASEWRESEIENGQHKTEQFLLRIARLLRRHEAIVDKYGEDLFEEELAGAQWYPFILLGKLLPVTYLLVKSC